MHILDWKRITSEKFSLKARIGKLIGYRGHQNYKIWLPAKARTVIIPHITFDENIIDREASTKQTTEGADSEGGETLLEGYNPNISIEEWLRAKENKRLCVKLSLAPIKRPHGQPLGSK